MLLPEMPFYPWIAAEKPFELQKWEASVAEHERWVARLSELAPASVLASRTVAQRRNEGFVWEPKGYRAVHDKYYLPEEAGFWEATWYERGEPDFTAVRDHRLSRQGLRYVPSSGLPSTLGITHSKEFTSSHAHAPRKNRPWTSGLQGGRAAAVMAGAFCISSNRSGEGSGIHWGGNGWIIDPDGELLGLTSSEDPFLTLDLDLEAAERAKATYPRYVAE